MQPRYFIKKGTRVWDNPEFKGTPEIVSEIVYLDVLEEFEHGHKVRLYRQYGQTEIGYLGSVHFDIIYISNMQQVISSGIFNAVKE